MEMRTPKEFTAPNAEAKQAAIQYRLTSAQEKPWDHSFTSLLRYLAARHSDTTPQVGKATRPRQEPFRLGQQPTLSFAPREVAEVNNTQA